MGKPVAKKYTNVEKKEMVLTYLKDKYGEEFEGLSYSMEELMQTHDEFHVYPKNKTKAEAFTVTGFYNESGYFFNDGYYEILIRPKFEETLRDIIDRNFSDYKIHTVVTDFDMTNDKHRFDKVDSFDPNKEISNIQGDTYVYVKKMICKNLVIKDEAYKIACRMIEEKIAGNIRIIIIRDDKYEAIKLDEENWKKATSEENVVERYDLLVKKDFTIFDYKGV